MEPMPPTNPTAAPMPNVALAGFYGAGNFGDDLSASLFGLALRRLGIPFRVYGLCEPYVARFGFQRAASLDELLDTAGAFVWGGGGLLVSWSRLTYRVLYPSAASGLDRLVRAVLARGIPVLLTSIGGDGRPLRTLTPAYRARLVEAAQSVTVRNPQDVALLEAVGHHARYFPDIVWGLSRVRPMARRRSERPRIGVDLYPSNVLRQGALRLLPRLQAAVNARPECDFVFMDTTNASCRKYRGLAGIIRGPNVSRHQFRDPDEDLAFIASLDAVFSSRLHVPVVAMQYGVPALSVCAEPKTRLLFANLGLERYSFHRERASELGALMASRAALDRVVAEFAFPEAGRLAAESQGHVACLQDALAQVAERGTAALRAELPC